MCTQPRRQTSTVGDAVNAQLNTSLAFWCSKKLLLNHIIFWIGWCRLVTVEERRWGRLLVIPLLPHRLLLIPERWSQGVTTIFLEIQLWATVGVTEVSFPCNLLCHSTQKVLVPTFYCGPIRKKLHLLNFGRVESTALCKW